MFVFAGHAVYAYQAAAAWLSTHMFSKLSVYLSSVTNLTNVILRKFS